MYIAPGQGQKTSWGQMFDVNRKPLSLRPFVASFQQISLNSDFTLNATYNVTDNRFAIFQKREKHSTSNFHLAKSFNETNNHVKITEKYFVVFTKYVRI